MSFLTKLKKANIGRRFLLYLVVLLRAILGKELMANLKDAIKGWLQVPNAIASPLNQHE
jgi:Na+/alanine symporter